MHERLRRHVASEVHSDLTTPEIMRAFCSVLYFARFDDLARSMDNLATAAFAFIKVGR